MLYLIFIAAEGKQDKANITPHLALHQSLWPDDFIEDVLPHVRVHSTQGIIQEVDVGFLVHSTCYTDTLLLATTQIDALQ